MSKKNRTLSVCALLLALSSVASLPLRAQFSDSHTVTVTVSEITVLSVNMGVSLAVTSAGVVAGEDLMTATDQTSTLTWGLNGTNKKITVSTNNGAPLFTLKDRKSVV